MNVLQTININITIKVSTKKLIKRVLPNIYIKPVKKKVINFSKVNNNKSIIAIENIDMNCNIDNIRTPTTKYILIFNSTISISSRISIASKNDFFHKMSIEFSNINKMSIKVYIKVNNTKAILKILNYKK